MASCHRFFVPRQDVLLCAAIPSARAIEQLEIWDSALGPKSSGPKRRRSGGRIVRRSASCFRSHSDYVIVDTAGRLHTKTTLWRVGEDAANGAANHSRGPTRPCGDGCHHRQNGLQQARQFTEAAGVTGIVLTKLDGTARAE